MEIDGNYRGIDKDCRDIYLIQGSHPLERERERERCTNALTNWFIFHFIFNVKLQSCIYRRLALISLAHMALSYWFYYSPCVLIIPTCVKCD